jgi:UDP-galactopyranose mutase
MSEDTVLIVGAGFAGAVHARLLAESGIKVHMIDRRHHIAGNAFDERSASGVRVHRYGPHLFHTNMEHIVAWLSRFGRFIPYELRVEALLADGRYTPLPINRRTINTVFGVDLRTAKETENFLATRAKPHPNPTTAAEYLASRIGTELTDLFFRPYTFKMWGLDLEQMDANVVKRIPLRFDDEDRYFPSDKYQILPQDGYTNLFANILDHKNIRINLGVEFDRTFLSGYRHCFTSMSIDTYFKEALGQLPYRSLRFHHRECAPNEHFGSAAVINFTDDGPFTRQTDWSLLPGHGGTSTTRTLTREEPCDFRDNAFERYYPVKTSDGRYDALYRRYLERAAAQPEITFIGRCGTYQYLDMHQVINQSMVSAARWLDSQNLSVC